jgi:hypothetical protein
MGLSQVKGCCYFCKTHLEPQQHRLFYSCLLTFPVIQDIQLFIFEVNNVIFNEKPV